MREKYLDLARELKKMEYEGDVDPNCAQNITQMIS